MLSMYTHVWNIKYFVSTFLLLAYLLWKQWTSYQRLAKFRGPFWASFTNLWMAKNMSSGEIHKKVSSTMEEYGELVRVGPNMLYTTNPDLVHRMNSVRSGYTRSAWYAGQRVEPDSHQVFSLVDEKEHTKRRAQVATGYSGKEIDGLETMIDEHVKAFIGLIRQKNITSAETKPLDFAQAVTFFTMDAITDIAFGEPWGFVAADEDIGEWCKSIEGVIPVANMVSTLPWLSYLLNIPFIMRMIMPSDKDEKGPGKLLRNIRNVVEQRFEVEAEKQTRDMLGSFLRHGLTRKELISETSLQIIAGSDTTAATIRATLLYIISNPQIYNKLLTEIGSITTTSPIISSSQSRTLPYLQAVIKEGIRIWPGGTLPVPKVVPPSGDSFNNLYFPPGTEIGTDTWGMQHSKKIYGYDADIFRPERWLEEADSEKLARMKGTMGLVFGTGRYGCLGKNIALMELDKIFFELLRNFEFQVVFPDRPWDSKNYGMWFQKNMFLRVKDRLA